MDLEESRFAAPPAQRKAADGSLNGKDKVAPKQRPQTLDARFADMKEKRMRAAMSWQQAAMRGTGRQIAAAQRRRSQQQQQQQRGRGGSGSGGAGRLFGNYVK